MHGRIVIVTGGNGGIGLETATGLARLGARVILVTRSRERGEAALEQARVQSGSGEIELLLADLSRQADIHALVDAFSRRHDRLDVLINNAAIIPPRRVLTADGIEMQFAVNHLAYFMLATLLIDRLRAAPQGRIINVSSAIHVFGRVDFDHLQNDRQYHALWFPIRGWQAYSNTKLMNILFTRELARRLTGTPITANSLHPGIIDSRLYRTTPEPLRFIRRGLFSSPEEGARTSIYLAASPDVSGATGKYFAASRSVGISAAAGDEGAARRLWDISAAMTGLSGGIMG